MIIPTLDQHISNGTFLLLVFTIIYEIKEFFWLIVLVLATYLFLAHLPQKSFAPRRKRVKLLIFDFFY